MSRSSEVVGPVATVSAVAVSSVASRFAAVFTKSSTAFGFTKSVVLFTSSAKSVTVTVSPVMPVIAALVTSAFSAV